MTISRRSFLASAAAAPVIGSYLSLPRVLAAADAPFAADPTRFEPWIEVYPAALRENVRVLARLAGGRPITAVIKNNGYGLGLVEVARALEPASEVAGFGVVKVAEALALREAGIRKPVQGQLYIDTGMSRMGLPYHSALPIIRDLARMPQLRITGMLSELTEEIGRAHV